MHYLGGITLNIVFQLWALSKRRVGIVTPLPVPLEAWLTKLCWA